MLHITNGTSVSLQQTGLPGDILVWIDVLHDGPVPEHLDAAELRRVRGLFLDTEWPDAAPAEIALWFEHDLFDQLQLIQILDRVHGVAAKVSLISVDRYLGRMSAEELAALWPARHDVSDAEF